jgi:hypothetical protein
VQDYTTEIWQSLTYVLRCGSCGKAMVGQEGAQRMWLCSTIAEHPTEGWICPDPEVIPDSLARLQITDFLVLMMNRESSNVLTERSLDPFWSQVYKARRVLEKIVGQRDFLVKDGYIVDLR